MASRVNVKFVIILSTFLVLAAGGVGGAYFFVKYRSGDRYASLGDRAMKDGKIDLADSWYERAVGKEPTNVDWLKKWRVAREQKIPTTQGTYVQNYQMYRGIIRGLAISQKTDIKAHHEYLDMIYQECAGGPSKNAYEFLAHEADDLMRYFSPEEPIELRRYRGLGMSGVAQFDPATPATDRDKARRDLEAVLKANPKDGEVAVELAILLRTVADRAKVASDDTVYKSNIEAAQRVMKDLLAADPDNPEGRVQELIFDAADASQVDVSAKSGADTTKARAAALDALAPRVQQVAEVLKKYGPSKLSSGVLFKFIAIAPRLDLKTGSDIVLAVVEKGLAESPDNVDLLLAKVQVTSMKADLQGVIAQYQVIVDAKDKPVSLAGLRLLSVRNRARFAQANAALQLAAQTKDPEARKAAMEKAKALRTVLARFVPDPSPELQFIDAETASIEGNIPRARQLLAEFLKKPGDVSEATMVEAMLLMADVGLRSNPQELGLARENLQRVLQARPGATEVRLILAGVERSLQNYAGAAAIYQYVLEVDPDNKIAKQELETLQSLRGEKKLDDPVMQSIVDAENLLRGDANKIGDEAGAEALLEKAFERYRYDPRLALQLASLRFGRGNADGAKQACELCIDKNPEDAASAEVKLGLVRVKDFLRRVKAADSIETVADFIIKSDMAPVDKQIQLYRAYTQFGKKDEATKALAEAARLAPDDPRVVELQFQIALQADSAEAGRLADRAAKLDLDHAEGETYKARLQINQKSYREAAATLARCVERGNATAAVYRLLGLVQAELGRNQDAMQSFRRSIELSPNDLLTIKTYLGVLVKANELSEAVTIARAVERIGKNDPEFLNTWLVLEARQGRADFARERREQIWKRNPGDTENAAALADLYMDNKAWDAARAIIDGLRKDETSLRAVVLDARWQADKGNLDKAIQVYRDYIGTLNEKGVKQTPDAYITFGQFLSRHGRTTEAMAAFRQASNYQDPATHSVDILLGDFQLTEGHFEDAEKSYRRALDANVPDLDYKIRKRLIEALNQQQKFAAAEAVLASLGPVADDDVELLCQRAGAAKGLGDVAKARAMLDRAITKFPDEPMPYLRRARIVMQDKAMAKDALADLATAIKLRPAFWQALRTRALLNLSLGRPEDGMRDLREAADRNPGMDDLKFEVIEYLVRFGKEAEAVDVADSSIKLRPNDLRMIESIAGIFARAGRWSRAARYYKLEWLQLQDDASATSYLNALMNSTPIALDEAQAVFSSPALKVDKSWRLMLMRALMKRKQGKEDACQADVIASFDSVGIDSKAALEWSQLLRRVYPEVPKALEMLNLIRTPPVLVEWMKFAACLIAVEDPKMVGDAVRMLRALRETVKDHDLRASIQRLLSDALIRQSAWEEAVTEMMLGLQIEPGDALLCNNVADVMSDKQNKPREALQYAERACRTDTTRWEYLDTLAGVYWKLGEKAQGVRMLESALRLTRAEVDKASTAVKLASWKLQTGDKAGARPLLDQVREMMSDSPTLADTMKAKVEELNKEFEAAPGK